MCKTAWQESCQLKSGSYKNGWSISKQPTLKKVARINKKTEVRFSKIIKNANPLIQKENEREMILINIFKKQNSSRMILAKKYSQSLKEGRRNRPMLQNKLRGIRSMSDTKELINKVRKICRPCQLKR